MAVYHLHAYSYWVSRYRTCSHTKAIPLYSIYHILFNVLTQLVLGLPLELVHKFWRVTIVYMAGVLAGANQNVKQECKNFV